ncbi:hypothetical protein STSP2_03288 [Anaerohalosphaera lusitana]|uniref:Uncharacterized protein n=1 Tax=Anaerohalosphaera lusitana TaxID=1936003 RepID=A0A1U9NRC8_9BACT|nr:hypothetical protein [Anaerohalosphaera lusitana]AQT70086.1 hypothetical protein STSP2_03288 [Anaerohalosphaera lusitana]
MKIFEKNHRQYRLAGSLNDFQMQMQMHLIDWKWKHITREPGLYGKREYDAILPRSLHGTYATVYPPVLDRLKTHARRFPFREHQYFNHMASSQAANVNLFLPVLISGSADQVLAKIKPDFARLATDKLDNGWQIEYWNKYLGDKRPSSGTDSDMAIAYYDHDGRLCLWLIEHKLTEAEFTTCGGAKSGGRQACHDCTGSLSDILADKNVCYYHSKRQFNYWKLTEANRDFFAGADSQAGCPFKGGMNQLWRNQLMGLAAEADPACEFERAFFSVVRHPGNRMLDATMDAYCQLTANSEKFRTFTSADVIAAATQTADPTLQDWARWYCDLYNLPLPGEEVGAN